jgi:murein DD-endopeptidase MepM/ murein hydrolase activator NlpD
MLLEVVPLKPAYAALDEGRFIPSSSQLSAGVNVEPYYHNIEKGDTLWNISQKYSVSLEKVKSLNKLDDQSILTVGKRLQIPGKESGRHTVKQGETLWDIARLYNISLNELCLVNQGVNPQNLKIGMSLVLPRGVQSTNIGRFTPSRSSRGSVILSWPVVGAITSAFGWRSSGFHHGMDIAAGYGESVRAAATGLVSFAGSKSVYGNTVTIKHTDGSETLYAHMSKIFVSEGQQINHGDTIGAVGTSGNATGPHLHLELRKDNRTINPSNALR